MIKSCGALRSAPCERLHDREFSINCYGAFMVHGLDVMERLNNEEVGKPSIAHNRRIEMDYPDALLRVWRFADEDSSRFALGFVKLDFPNGRIEATDGRIAVRNAVAFGDSFVALSPVMLYRNDLRQAAKFFATSKYRGLKLVNDGDRWYAENAEARFVLQTDDGRWPDMDAIFTRKPERVVRFTISAQKLRLLCAVYESKIPGEDTPLTFRVPLDGTNVIAIKTGNSVETRLMTMGKDTEEKLIVVEPTFEPEIQSP